MKKGEFLNYCASSRQEREQQAEAIDRLSSELRWQRFENAASWVVSRLYAVDGEDVRMLAAYIDSGTIDEASR
jgi:hypothetical protein